MTADLARVGPYTLALDRSYHPTDHTWAVCEGELVRIGMDDLGQETSGDLAHLALRAVGDAVTHGDQVGSLEAQKFVGPLRSPVCGEIVAVNDALASDPRLVNTDPYGDGWIALLRPTGHTDADLASLIPPGSARAWFEGEVDRFRRQGALAE
jgi:glycine cleavage system H protein